MAAPINPQAYYTNNTGYQIPQQAQMSQFPQYAYQQPQQYQIPNLSKQEYVFVKGKNKAMAYPVAPGNKLLLLDEDDNVFYMKTSDSFRVFRYEEENPIESVKQDFVTRQEFDDLKKLIEDLTK